MIPIFQHLMYSALIDAVAFVWSEDVGRSTHSENDWAIG